MALPGIERGTVNPGEVCGLLREPGQSVLTSMHQGSKKLGLLICELLLQCYFILPFFLPGLSLY